MARTPRPTHAGIYHAGIRSPHGLAFFHDPEDYYVFVGILARALLFERVTCLAFCLMTTHYHLLLEVGEGALPRMMKRLNWHYARSVNRRLGGHGHVVGGRYFSIPVSDTDHLLVEFRYIALNPVEAGVCERPEDWRWSSYAGAIGLEPEFGFVDSRLLLAGAGSTVSALRALVSDTKNGV